MIDRMRLATSPSLRDLITGMPPPTLASKPTSTPFAAAAAKMSRPSWESSALLAVTTCLPASMASRTKVLAGSMPPISSTIMSIFGSLIRSRASRVSGTWLNRSGRASVPWSAMPARRMDIPVRRTSRSCCASSTSAKPLPTVPKPIMPTRISFIACCHLQKKVGELFASGAFSTLFPAGCQNVCTRPQPSPRTGAFFSVLSPALILTIIFRGAFPQGTV